MSWNVLGCLGMSWDVLRYLEMSWEVLGCLEVSRYVVEYLKISVFCNWHPLSSSQLSLFHLRRNDNRPDSGGRGGRVLRKENYAGLASTVNKQMASFGHENLALNEGQPRNTVSPCPSEPTLHRKLEVLRWCAMVSDDGRTDVWLLPRVYSKWWLAGTIVL